METRQGAELRALPGSKIAGVAMKYDVMGRTSGGRRERFLPGAFGQVPAEMSVSLQHDQNSIVGRVKLTDTATELRADGEVTPSVHSLIRRGFLNGFSVEFDVTDEATVPDFGASVREVRGALLGALSVVQVPAHPASRLEARAEVRQRAGGFRTRLKTGRTMDCKCAGGEAREVIFEVPAFRGVEQLDVTAISRGANDVIASTATGSLTLTRTAAGALSILMIPLDTAAGRGLEELVDADVDVYARPTWTTDESEFEVVDGVARVTRAFFKYLLVRPVPEDDARGIDPLRPVRSARGLSLSRRRLLLA